MRWLSFGKVIDIKVETGPGRGSAALRPTAARLIQSLLSIPCALYEGVLLLALSSCPRAFYDCTLIVEALFCNERYFRLCAVVHSMYCMKNVK